MVRLVALRGLVGLVCAACPFFKPADSCNVIGRALSNYLDMMVGELATHVVISFSTALKRAVAISVQDHSQHPPLM